MTIGMILGTIRGRMGIGRDSMSDGGPAGDGVLIGIRGGVGTVLGGIIRGDGIIPYGGLLPGVSASVPRVRWLPEG